MLNIDKTSNVPIYEQVKKQIKELILNGQLKEDDIIPSVRELSKDLIINPNTIQKAYNDLELQQITYTVPGVGRFVKENAIERIKSESGEIMEQLTNVIEQLVKYGVSNEKIIETVSKILSELKSK